MTYFPRISIITPSFNQGVFIEETILSVLNQNYPNLEYIIIDGGSTDETVDIIKKYEDRLTYWISEEDNGQAHAINKGLEIATGDIVNWLNSDDFLLPNALNIIAKIFNQNPKVDFVYGDTLQVSADGTLLYVNKIIPFNKSILLFGRIMATQPSVFFKRKVIEEVNYLNVAYRFCMDLEFWTKSAFINKKFQAIYEPLSGNRFHKDTKTINQQNLLKYEHKIIQKNYSQFIKILPDSVHSFLYETLRNIFRIKWGILKMFYRNDFKFNRSRELKKGY